MELDTGFKTLFSRCHRVFEGFRRGNSRSKTWAARYQFLTLVVLALVWASACSEPVEPATSQEAMVCNGEVPVCTAALDCGPGEYCSADGICKGQWFSNTSVTSVSPSGETKVEPPSESDKQAYYQLLGAALDRALLQAQSDLSARQTQLATMSDEDLRRLRDDTVLSACSIEVARLRAVTRETSDSVSATVLAQGAEQIPCVTWLKARGIVTPAGVPWEPAVHQQFQTSLAQTVDNILKTAFSGKAEIQSVAKQLKDYVSQLPPEWGISVVDKRAEANACDGRLYLAIDADIVPVLKQEPHERENSRLSDSRYWMHFQTDKLKDLVSAVYHANTLLAAPASALDTGLFYTSIQAKLASSPDIDDASFRSMITSALTLLMSNVTYFQTQRQSGGRFASYSEANLKMLAGGSALRAFLEYGWTQKRMVERVEVWLEAESRRQNLQDFLISIGTGVSGLLLAIFPPSWPLVVGGAVLLGATGFRAYERYRDALLAQQAYLTSADDPVFYSLVDVQAAQARFLTAVLDAINGASGFITQGFRLALRATNGALVARTGSSLSVSDLPSESLIDELDGLPGGGTAVAQARLSRAEILRDLLRNYMKPTLGPNSDQLAGWLRQRMPATYQGLADWINGFRGGQYPNAWAVYQPDIYNVPWQEMIQGVKAGRRYVFTVVQESGSNQLGFFAFTDDAVRVVYDQSAAAGINFGHTLQEMKPGIVSTMFQMPENARYAAMWSQDLGPIDFSFGLSNAGEYNLVAPMGVTRTLGFPEVHMLRYGTDPRKWAWMTVPGTP